MRKLWKPYKASFLNWRGYLLAIALVALITLIKYFTPEALIPLDKIILYMLAIVPTAFFFGLGPAIFASILSVLAYEFIFIPLFNINDPNKLQYIIVIIIFLLVGVLTSYLASNLRRKNEESQRLNVQMMTAQEEERKRIAYELHDDTIQSLAILKLQIESIMDSKEIASPEVNKKLEYLQSDTDRAIKDIRRYSHELRPSILDHVGLAAALEQLAEDTRGLGLKVELTAEGKEEGLTDEIRLALFRITQEALNNARKHAQVKEARINIKFQKDKINLSITDNGEGFDVDREAVSAAERGSLGLSSMRQRAEGIGASLKIESKRGQGTRVRVEVRI